MHAAKAAVAHAQDVVAAPSCGFDLFDQLFNVRIEARVYLIRSRTSLENLLPHPDRVQLGQS